MTILQRHVKDHYASITNHHNTTCQHSHQKQLQQKHFNTQSLLTKHTQNSNMYTYTPVMAICTRSTFFALNLSFSGHNHVGSFFTHEKREKKKLACDIIDTSATYARLVHDITRITGHKMAAFTAMFSTLHSCFSHFTYSYVFHTSLSAMFSTLHSQLYFPHFTPSYVFHTLFSTLYSQICLPHFTLSYVFHTSFLGNYVFNTSLSAMTYVFHTSLPAMFSTLHSQLFFPHFIPSYVFNTSLTAVFNTSLSALFSILHSQLFSTLHSQLCFPHFTHSCSPHFTHSCFPHFTLSYFFPHFTLSYVFHTSFPAMFSTLHSQLFSTLHSCLIAIVSTLHSQLCFPRSGTLIVNKADHESTEK